MIVYKKDLTNKTYADLACYCNSNNCHIEDKGEYLESVENPIIIPTLEEQKQKRAEAYRIKKDPITCEILSLKDEEQTKEIIKEIEELKLKRAKVVKKIQEQYPYPLNLSENVDEDKK